MSTLSRLLCAHPVDRTAVRVLSHGIHYDVPYNYGSMIHSENPLPLRDLAKENPQVQAIARQLVGSKFGRFTVIGLYLAVKPNNKRAAWVVRCTCGCYEVRSAKAIRNPSNSKDRCKKCQHVAFIKRRYEELRGVG